jgi:hypothetical protein
MKKGSHCSDELKIKLSKAKENYIPWNKGLKNSQPLNSSNWKKGQPAWNKGKENHWLKGILNPNWKGGITPLNHAIRESIQYSEWRGQIFKRDSFTCEVCKNVGGDLEAHHIKEFHLILKENNITTFEGAMECSLLWDINNGITLCKECHDKTK